MKFAMESLSSTKTANVLEVSFGVQVGKRSLSLSLSLVELESSQAAKKAITEVVLSRIAMAVPGETSFDFALMIFISP